MKVIRPTPTLLFLVTFISGMLLTYVLPWHMTQYLNNEAVRILGLLSLGISFILNLLAYRQFRNHSTPHAPFSDPKVLINTGVFAYSRNPVYLALVLSQCALGFIFDTVWLIFMSIILLMALHYLVILEEERVLEREFQERYSHYKNTTRRWI